MQTLTLLILFFTTAIAAVSADRRIQQRKAAKMKMNNPSTQATQAAAIGVAAGLSGWIARFLPKKDLEPSRRFRVWSIEAFADQPALQAWLKALPDPAIQALVTHLASFCTEMNVDLNWLFEQQAQQQLLLTRDMQTIVLHYVQACYTAVGAQDGVHAFKSYREFDQNPYAKVNQGFVQALFATLLDQKLTPPKVATFDQAPEHERQIYMVQAIRRAAETEPIRFQHALIKAIKQPASLHTNGHKPTSTNNQNFNFAAAEKQTAA